MEAIQGLFNLLACSRRNPTSTSPIPQEDTSKAKATASDSESTLHSTESGDISSTDLSDHSEQTTGSPDASDNEVPLREFKPVGPPPGLSLISPPPGLDAPPQHAVEAKWQDQGQTRLGTRLNSQAALFVPSFGAELPSVTVSPAPQLQNSSQPLRQTISLLKGVLEEFEATMPAEQQATLFQQQRDEEAQTRFALQEALSKLTPHDAARLRTFLDTKEAQQSQSDSMMESWQLPATQMAYGEMHEPTFQATMPGPVAPHPLPLGEMVPPPGTFCCNQPPMMGSSCWMPAMLASGQPQPYTPFGSKQRGPSKAARNIVLADKIQSTVEPVDDAKETLRTNLRDLSLLDPSCVLMVRKINRLGIESPKLLEAYFSKFGTVDRVMVSHSRAKSIFGRGAARVRPAGLGFLVMTKAEEVEAVLAAGPEHDVEGVSISAHPFESRPIDGENVEDQ